MFGSIPGGDPPHPDPAQEDRTMTPGTRSTASRLAELEGDDGLLANGTLAAAVLVGAGLGLAILGLSMASLWQWIGG
jgi:hypothetical protein